MTQFVNVFTKITGRCKVNFKLVAEKRRITMESQGLDTSRINWELYARILEEKQNRLNLI